MSQKSFVHNLKTTSVQKCCYFDSKKLLVLRLLLEFTLPKFFPILWFNIHLT